eukprot:TRINITY_DN1165_c9_g1_i1.p1 TRINITY_DN1165_c9_g1~~TRINITY_DN1165_c9_g1_i1.p1  ORF type:complete len:412 (+),score=40.56 TRINITY_DN1165_c9_g1_i1:62-1297(+)
MLTPTRCLYRTVQHAARRHGRSDKETSEALKKIIPVGTDPDWTLEVNTKLKGLGNKIRIVIEDLRKDGEVGTRTFTVGIMLCALSGLDDAAWDVYGFMKNANVPPDKQTFKWLMTAASKQGNVERTEAAWKLMRRHGFCRQRENSLTSFVFCSVVSAYNKAGRHDDAFKKAKSFLKIEKLKLNSYCLKEMLHTKNLTRSVSILKWAEEVHKIVPDTGCFAALLSCCNQTSEARQLTAEMHTRSIPIDKKCWHEILLVFVRASDYPGALQISEHISSLGLVSSLTYKTLLSLCFNELSQTPATRDPQEVLTMAKGVFLRSVIHGFGDLPGINYRFAAVLAASGRVDEMEAHREEMKGKNIPETDSLLPVFRKCYLLNGDQQGAEGVVIRGKDTRKKNTHDVHKTLFGERIMT